MSKLLPILFLPLALLVALVAVSAPAAAHGIIITDGDVVIVTPRPPGRTVEPERRSPVRLRDHRVEATIHGQVADVQVEQVFHNDSNRQLEGTYLFPLPEGATVAKFAMTMGGKMVQGEIVEAEQARRIYHDIVRRQRDPGLLEYLGRGLFRAKVFPILPHQDLTIRLQFQQILPDTDGTLEFRYPLATSRLHGENVENALVHVKVESDVDLKALYSPSHSVAVVRDGERKADVSYERAGRAQDRDFLLYVGRSPDDVGFSFVSTKAAGEDGTFLAVLAPSTQVREADRVAKDVVYVLDTSGSMAQDDKLEQAKKALEYGVRTLREGDRFNIVGFATQIRPFRDGLVPATKEMKEAAAAWIQKLVPAGGTYIEGGLKDALAMGGTDRLFMVVFITDGRPTVGERDVDKLAALVEQQNKTHARVFTFGVGFDLEVRLLDRIAEATRGSRDYVMPGEDLEVVTSRFFRKVTEPVMSDVTVEFGEGIHDVYPAVLPDLFAGGQVVILGRYQAPGDRLIRLSGKVGSRDVVHEYEATFAGDEHADYLPRLWAHRKVGYLLDEIRLHGEDKELVDEIVRLATRHGIVTPYTAGLVVEESEMLEGRARPVAAESARAVDSLRRRLGGGAGTRGGVPTPGLAGPAADGAAPVAAPTSPSAPPPAEREARDSAELKKLKDGRYEDDEEAGDAYGLEQVREKVKSIAGKTFLQGTNGRWVDTAYDGKAETVKVKAYSDEWLELLEALQKKHGKKAASYLSLGEKVLFVLDGKAYEVIEP